MRVCNCCRLVVCWMVVMVWLLCEGCMMVWCVGVV